MERQFLLNRYSAGNKGVAKIAVAGGVLIFLALVVHLFLTAHFLRMATVPAVGQAQANIDKWLPYQRAEIQDQYGSNNFHYAKCTYKIKNAKILFTIRNTSVNSVISQRSLWLTQLF